MKDKRVNKESSLSQHIPLLSSGLIGSGLVSIIVVLLLVPLLVFQFTTTMRVWTLFGSVASLATLLVTVLAYSRSRLTRGEPPQRETQISGSH